MRGRTADAACGSGLMQKDVKEQGHRPGDFGRRGLRALERDRPDAHPVDIHVGRRIRFFRRQQGLSQTALGTPLDLTFQQVQKYERGANRVSASKLYEIARVLGVTVSELFDGLPASVNRSAQAVHGEIDGILDRPESAELLSAFFRLPASVRRAAMKLLQQIADLPSPSRCQDASATCPAPEGCPE